MKEITRDMLVCDLEELGVRQGDCVMLHSSLSSLGFVQGGAATVVDAFLEAMGPEGTLVTPAFTEGAWGEHLTMPDCEDGCPREFCPSEWPSHEGAIPNAALVRPGRLRSCHPTHSWVGNGKRANELLRNHKNSPTPCGHGCPFEKLVELDGCIVTLGVGTETVTLWHYFEDILGLPYRGYYHPKERHLSYCVSGKRIQYKFPGIMNEVVRAAGIVEYGKVGKSTSGLIRAGKFKQFMATIIANNPYCLVLRPPLRDNDSLIIDALQKASAMLEAWERGPKEPPGKMDWPEGSDDDVVRQDCPAFAGYHRACEQNWPLCRANDRHPELFKYGGLFTQYGKTTCGRCSWNLRFPLRS